MQTLRPGYLKTPRGQHVPIVTLGDGMGDCMGCSDGFGAIDIDLQGWLQGWNNWANDVRNVAGGVATVTNAANLGLQQSKNPFQPTAADVLAQKYNTLAYVTPGGGQTLLLIGGGVLLLMLLSSRKGRA